MDANNQQNIDRAAEQLFCALRPEDAWRPDMGRGLARLQEQRTSRSARERRWILAGAVAMAVCVPLIAFPATRALAARCVSACVTETGAVRQFLLGGVVVSPHSSTLISPENRKPVPDFTLEDATGKAVTLSELRGKVVLLNFWATWCFPCAQEIPWFIEFQQTRQATGLEVLGVSMDEDGWKSVRPFIGEKHINYTVAIGNDKLAQKFGGLQSLPLSLVIDRSGRIAAIHASLSTKAEYQAEIDAVLNER